MPSATVDPVVHLAGADNHFVDRDGRREHRMAHHHAGEDPRRAQQTLVAGLTEQAEYHCFFARTDAIRAIAPLDEQLRSMCDHLDACLRIRERGGAIWFEPASFVSYVAPRRVVASDVPFRILRWSRRWNEDSAARFGAEWGVASDDPETRALVASGDYLRYRAYRPYRSVMGRLLALRGRTSRPLPDRVFTPLFVWLGERKRARAEPPLLVHRASWDTN